MARRSTNPDRVRGACMVSHLFVERESLRQLDHLQSVRAQAERPPDPTDGYPAKPAQACPRTWAPVRRLARRRTASSPKSGTSHAVLTISDAPESPWPRLIQQPVEAVARKPRPRLSDGLLRQAQLSRDHGVTRAAGALEYRTGERAGGAPPAQDFIEEQKGRPLGAVR